MRLFTTGRRKAITGIAALGSALAMVVTGGVSYQLVTSTDAALTDVLTFGGAFRPKPAEIEPTGQWSYSVVSLDVEPGTKGTSSSPQPFRHELQREFSEQAQSRQVSGGACVWGGAGASCNDTETAAAAADATATRNIDASSWDPGGTAASSYFRAGSPLTTGVRCTAQGDSSTLQSTAPTGVIQYGNDSYWWFPQGFHNFDVGTQASGASVRHQVARGTDTHTEVSMTKSHGTDKSQHQAWSEVVLKVRGEHQGGYSETLTYTFRSECGISFNDGSGSTDPRGVSGSADRGGFANFLRSMVPWLDDDEAREEEVEAAGDADETTTSESEKSDSSSTDATGADTGEKKTASSKAEKSDSRDTEDEKTASSKAEESSEKSTSSKPAESDDDRTNESKPKDSSTTEATEEPTADTEAPEPLPTTAPGSPRSSGFSDASTLTLNGTDYHVLATRQLGGNDQQTLAGVEAAALAAVEDHTFTGSTGGATWSYYSGTGIDVIEVVLPDGSIAQLRLASHGAALPQPDVAKPTEAAEPAAPTEDDAAAAPTQDDEE